MILRKNIIEELGVKVAELTQNEVELYFDKDSEMDARARFDLVVCAGLNHAQDPTAETWTPARVKAEIGLGAQVLIQDEVVRLSTLTKKADAAQGEVQAGARTS